MVFIKKPHSTKQILSKYVLNVSPSTSNFSKSFLKISISLTLQETLISMMLHDFILQRMVAFVLCLALLTKQNL